MSPSRAASCSCHMSAVCVCQACAALAAIRPHDRDTRLHALVNDRERHTRTLCVKQRSAPGCCRRQDGPGSGHPGPVASAVPDGRHGRASPSSSSWRLPAHSTAPGPALPALPVCRSSRRGLRAWNELKSMMWHSTKAGTIVDRFLYQSGCGFNPHSSPAEFCC